MNASCPTPETADRFRALAIRAVADASLRQIGRMLLVLHPFAADTAPETGFNAAAEVQSEWIDEQLYDCLPWQSELSRLDDARCSALESAWPEGFDEVVFSDGSRDEVFARNLIEPYLEWADRFCIPLMTEFDVTKEEMDDLLVNDFRQMIVEWRENVLKRMEKRYADNP